ncbi:hypothetical protein BGX24_011774 [Mortierella sp. AD032]|nr:hypothetical protein BGX24_011774 [Mortierella sp. AD032]
MLQADSTPEHVQAFRAVRKSQKPSTTSAPLDSDDVTLIDCHTDPDTNKDFILWEDIQQVFDEALYIRNKTKLVAFLKGSDYQTLEPRRIAAVLGTVLDVILGGELVVPAVAMSTPTLTTTPTPLPLPSALQRIEQLSKQYSKYDPISAFSTPSRISIPRTQNRQVPEKLTQQARTRQLTLIRVRNIIKTLTTKVDLESLHANGDGSPEDFTKALECYLKAVGQGHAQAQFSVGDLFTSGKEVPQDSSMAMVWYLQAAKHGHMEAQFKVANAYERGSYGISQDYTLALQWLLKAADQGHGEAQVTLGDQYREGFGVNRNSRTAMDWYLKAAEKDHAQAQFMVGVIYLQHKYFEQVLHIDRYDDDSVQAHNGDSKQDGDYCVSKDEVKALQWFLKAAHQGLADAQFAVVYLPLRPHNFKGADSSIPFTIAEWCRKAADQNHVPAQIYMGNFYNYGYGVSLDRTRALEWFLKATGRSSGCAEFSLGTFYLKSHPGVPPDASTSNEWFQKADEQGVYTTQFLSFYSTTWARLRS